MFLTRRYFSVSTLALIVVSLRLYSPSLLFAEKTDFSYSLRLICKNHEAPIAQREVEVMLTRKDNRGAKLLNIKTDDNGVIDLSKFITESIAKLYPSEKNPYGLPPL